MQGIHKATAVQLVPQCVSVALVVDQPGLADRLRLALRRSDIDHVIEANSLRQLTSAATDEIDALIVRIGNTPREIVDAFKSARATFPDTPIVGVWPDAQGRQDQRALKAGLDGLLQESRITTSLAPVVRAVCTGLVCFPKRLPASGQVESLSEREKQVLGMLIMGFTNAEIARRLYLAESTVKSHLSSAYLKLGVRSRKDAAALILDPDEGLGTAILAISTS
jgi:DNA-binding NarL/FixJ family response regulator